MADESGNNGNGFPRWRDVDQLRQEHRREFDRLEMSTQERFKNAHEYYSGAHADLVAQLSKTESRVDELESVIDQQRGARNLVYALIGTNVLLAGMSFFTILHMLGIL